MVNNDENGQLNLEYNVNKPSPLGVDKWAYSNVSLLLSFFFLQI